MRYLLAIVLPPVAVLLCGKLIQFILNFFLTLCFWIPDNRADRIEKAIRESSAH